MSVLLLMVILEENQDQNVVLVSHNPVLSDLVSLLADGTIESNRQIGSSNVLRMMMERMRLSSDVVTVHEIALSNYSGVAYSPSVHRTGQEDVQASSTASRGHGKRVESLTLEDFAARQRIQTIHTLSLDAEGWDPRILRGAASLLRARRIELLEFEYAPKAWAGALGLWTLWSHRLSADEEARIKAGSRLHPALPPRCAAWLCNLFQTCSLLCSAAS